MSKKNNRALLESGDLTSADLPGFRSGAPAKTLEQIEAELSASYQSSAINSLHLSSEHLREIVTSLGMKILTAIEKRVEKRGPGAFKHFALDLVVYTLVPCKMCHGLSRARKIEAKTALMKQMAPALFITGKTSIIE